MTEKALAVDDSEVFRAALSGFLEEKGFEVTAASNGLEALERILESPYDLVFLDIEMPRMSGLQVCRILRTIPQFKDLPIVLLTGRGSRSDEFWGLEAGADAYLRKPFVPEEFIETTNRTLNQAARRRASGPAPPAFKKLDKIDVIFSAGEIQEKKLFDLTLFHKTIRAMMDAADSRQAAAFLSALCFQIAPLTAAGAALCDEGGLAFFAEINGPISRDVLQIFRDQIFGELSRLCGRSLDPRRAVFNLNDPNGLLRSGEDEEEEPSFQNINLPLKAGDRPFGLMWFAQEGEDPVSGRERELLERIVDLAGGPLRAVRALERESRMETTDPLTGLLNHRRFHELALEELDRARRRRTPTALAIVELGGLDDINREMGFAQGDAVLRAAADAVRGAARSSDLTGRSGGARFVCLAPETGGEKAAAWAERLRSAAAGCGAEDHEERSMRIAAAVGAVWTSGEGETGLFELIEKAKKDLENHSAG